MENKKNNSQPHSKSDKNNVPSENRPIPTPEDSKKYKFYRKPSLKKKGPEVKQTKTSLRRLLQANPLLQYEMEGSGDGKKVSLEVNRQNSIEIDIKNEPMQKQGTKTTNLKRSTSLKNPAPHQFPFLSKPRVSTILASNGPNENSTQSSKNARVHVGFSSSTPRMLTTNGLGASISKSDPFKVPAQIDGSRSKPIVKQPPVEATETTTRRSINHCKPIRRSLSAQHFDRKKGKSNKIAVGIISEDIKKTQSSEDVSIPIQGPYSGHEVSPITEVSNENIMVFKTPSAHERRSICQFTPRSTNISRRSIYHPSTPLPTLDELQKRLNDWLTKRGKSLSLFRHLEKFHPLEPVEDENKENIEIDQDLDRGSYEDLAIPKIAEFHENEADWEELAKAALVDLNNLIQEGYPVLQCEAWLELIRSKYSRLQEEPEYWECRAAIEQSRGNIINAVECYKTAIVQGAEVQVVDNSLDVLLQKFSLLNISIGDVDEKSVKDRARIIKDARDVFKSSIIKFAVQEKKIKKNNNQVKLVATPVRRSTRLSRSAYVSTPGMQICSSLRELDSPVREKLNFLKNKALD